MKITKETVKKIGDLARIEIREEEVDALAKELSKILTFMDKLNEVDTEHVAPLVHMNDDVNKWREDQAHTTLTPSQGMANAPVGRGNYFAVPKIIEK